jgi:hypothetical protein
LIVKWRSIIRLTSAWAAAPRKKLPFPDRVKSTLPVIVAKARRHEFHANAPYYGEEELATDIDPGDRALLIKEAALAASFLKAHAKADKINVGARQRGSPVPSACCGAVCRRSRLARFGLETGPVAAL